MTAAHVCLICVIVANAVPMGLGFAGSSGDVKSLMRRESRLRADEEASNLMTDLSADDLALQHQLLEDEEASESEEENTTYPDSVSDCSRPDYCGRRRGYVAHRRRRSAHRRRRTACAERECHSSCSSSPSPIDSFSACSGSGQDECCTCPSSKYLEAAEGKTGKCVSDCSSGFVKDYSSKKCLSCSEKHPGEHCGTCSNSGCTSCTNYKYLTSASTCVDECESGFHGEGGDEDGRTCAACPQDCDKCSITLGGNLSCTQCNPFKGNDPSLKLYLHEGNCIETCPTGFWATVPIATTCVSAWDKTCNTCSGKVCSCDPVDKVSISFGGEKHEDVIKDGTGGASVAYRPEATQSLACKGNICEDCNAASECWHGHPVRVGRLEIEVPKASTTFSNYTTEIAAKCGDGNGKWGLFIEELSYATLSVYVNENKVHTEISDGSIFQEHTINLAVVGDSRIRLVFTPMAERSVTASAGVMLSATGVDYSMDKCMSIKQGLSVFGDLNKNDASYKLRNVNSIQLQCLDADKRSELPAALKDICEKWLAEVTEDDKKLLKTFLLAAGVGAVPSSQAVQVDPNTCVDPSTSDPESWDCECLPKMTQACKTDVTYNVSYHACVQTEQCETEPCEKCLKECWNKQMCGHSHICQHWKIAQNCEGTNDAAATTAAPLSDAAATTAAPLSDADAAATTAAPAADSGDGGEADSDADGATQDNGAETSEEAQDTDAVMDSLEKEEQERMKLAAKVDVLQEQLDQFEKKVKQDLILDDGNSLLEAATKRRMQVNGTAVGTVDGGLGGKCM